MVTAISDSVRLTRMIWERVVRGYMERAVNRYDQGDLDDANMATIIAECNFMLRCQIEKRRLRQEAAREAEAAERTSPNFTLPLRVRCDSSVQCLDWGIAGA